jgi:hypothetical protein
MICLRHANFLHARALTAVLTLATVTLAISTEIPPHGKAIVLFDDAISKTLTSF